MNPYQKLLKKFREVMLIDSVSGILHWDLETYIPPRGVKQRSEQLALLRQLRHRLITSRKLSELLNQAEKYSIEESLDVTQKRNIYLIRKEQEEETKLPEELVAKIAQQQAITVTVWKKAKAACDWKRFEPELEKMLEFSKQRAVILRDVKDVATPYDALLDEFEPSMTSNQITQIFSQMRTSLIPLVNKCVEASKNVETNFLHQKIPIGIQQKITTNLVKFIGYDISSNEAGGRIDETEHPFTTGYYNDVRITLHYYEGNVASVIFATLHEGGHALYEQNINPNWQFQPIGTATSYGIHESQSRFIENIVGRSRDFWQYYLPHLNDLTSGIFAKVKLDDFIRAINRVKRSKIRIEADEVTYSLHIIIRFEIEQALFADKITVSELPDLWNSKYDEYLGVKIEHDSEGVMQDTHWASGLFGYFPSYALGNIYGGQLLAAMENDLPDWRSQIAAGNIQSIKQWLIEKVHYNARLYDPADLIYQITGKQPSSNPFLTYLQNKYSLLFGF
ncbi:MAG: carboxypeptidase M32 [Candidatus Heimdallarchaeota archaeon]